MHTLCSSSPPKLRLAPEVVQELEMKDQLELERVGVARIAECYATATARPRRAAFADLRDPAMRERILVLDAGHFIHTDPVSGVCLSLSRLVLFKWKNIRFVLSGLPFGRCKGPSLVTQ